VIDRGGVDVHQAGVQFGVDGCVWHPLPHAAHCLVGEQVQAHGFAVWCGL
jgi:hypothetical protein